MIERVRIKEYTNGDITGRYVIYRGEDAKVDGVQYLNVEKYLKSLKKLK